MFNTPGGMDQLKAMGLRNVPVVAVGESYTFAQNLKDVAKFLGVQLNREQLAPADLAARYDAILETAQRLVRQVPVDKLDERVIPNRPRILHPFLFHIFRIGEAFLIAYGGEEYNNTIANTDPPDSVRTPAEVVAYGQQIRERLAAWWASNADRNLEKKIDTYYGEQVAHDVFERTTWHSAQHTRQLAAVLERFGIMPDRPLTADQLKGLPLPDGLWE